MGFIGLGVWCSVQWTHKGLLLADGDRDGSGWLEGSQDMRGSSDWVDSVFSLSRRLLAWSVLACVGASLGWVTPKAFAAASGFDIVLNYTEGAPTAAQRAAFERAEAR